MEHVQIPPSDVITVEFDGHVTIVWLDRPEQRNAFAQEFWADLPKIMDALDADISTRVIVIAARGQSFTVGIDLKAFGPTLLNGGIDPSAPEQPTSDIAKRRATYAMVKRLQTAFTSIADSSKPVIAAIHGHCIGAGVDLITACDIRYASQDAIFSVRETKLAIVADVGTLQRLPGIVNPGHVAEMVYSGRDYTADEAAEIGLVTKVVPDATGVLQAAMETANTIAANSPLAVQGSKAVLNGSKGRTVTEALDYVALWNTAFLQSNDLLEAVSAYMQKRPPEFSGE
jgi:enoyl-CoA hydratase